MLLTNLDENNVLNVFKWKKTVCFNFYMRFEESLWLLGIIQYDFIFENSILKLRAFFLKNSLFLRLVAQKRWRWPQNCIPFLYCPYNEITSDKNSSKCHHKFIYPWMSLRTYGSYQFFVEQIFSTSKRKFQPLLWFFLCTIFLILFPTLKIC